MRQFSPGLYALTTDDLRAVKQAAYKRGTKRGMRIALHEVRQAMADQTGLSFNVPPRWIDQTIELAESNRRARGQ